MYESHWKLKSRPFQARCPAHRLYPGSSFTAALLRLRYCFDNGGGLAVLLGESGTGKTSLLRRFAAETDRWSPFTHILYSGLQPGELLRQVGMELCADGSLPAHDAPDLWLTRIHRFLLESAGSGRSAVVAFDDAHQMSDAALEHTVAPLLTLAESDPCIRLSIVLSGHPGLLPQLQRHLPIVERTEVMSVMRGWSCAETADYVAQSLLDAGATEPIFTDDAVHSVFELSAGIPRRINRLCDLALLVAAAEQRDRITAGDVDAVSSELVSQAA